MKKVLLIILLTLVINSGNTRGIVIGPEPREFTYDHSIGDNTLYGAPQLWFW